MNPIFPYPEADLKEWGKKLVQALNTWAGQMKGDTPAGVLWATAGEVPAGWLACDGSLLLIADNLPLYRAIGVKFNKAGDSADYFRVPDATGRVPMGSLVAYGGSGDLVLGANNLPALDLVVFDPGHTHGFVAAAHSHTLADPGHVHTVTGGGVGGSTVNVGGGATPVPVGGGSVGVLPAVTGITMVPAVAGGTIQAHNTGVSVHLPGNSDPLSVSPPFFGVTWIIKK